ncbi:hypothetical protein AB0L26_20360 [Streptomyces nondiastaticus]|uniref:hypothetical protein n=1 Tax=Streptomyces nondiastaticus TaxID=3154512 RepID=UPI00343AAED7
MGEGATTAPATARSLRLAAGWLPLMTGSGPIVATAFTALLGLFLTALITSAFLTVDGLAPAGTMTEAYAWLIASIGTGQATGTALPGAVRRGRHRRVPGHAARP